MKKEDLSSLILSILGIIIVIDAILEQFFNIGTKQNSLVIGYCIAFILLSIKFPNILKRKTVTIPIYIMIIQTVYSIVKIYLY
tara:strand:+ start:182 stop:430 length:249 start_codon:yes stop_codon:yes gene_type:complete